MSPRPHLPSQLRERLEGGCELLGFYVMGLANAGTLDPSLRMSKQDVPPGLPTLAILLCQAGNPRCVRVGHQC